jgi:hypothetical protein
MVLNAKAPRTPRKDQGFILFLAWCFLLGVLGALAFMTHLPQAGVEPATGGV